MVDLSTEYGGLRLKNPLIVASGSATHIPEQIEEAAKVGWAASVLKTHWSKDVERNIALDKISRPQYALVDASGSTWWRPVPPKATAPKRGRRRGRMSPDYSLVLGGAATRDRVLSFATQYYRSYDEYLNFINRSKDLTKDYDFKVIASIDASTEEGWEENCRLVNESKADAVELNFGCFMIGAVNPETDTWSAVGCGSYPELVRKWTRYCRERIKNIPVMVKLPPHCPDLMASAIAAQESGAVGIQYADAGPFIQYPIRPIFIDPETEEVGNFPGMPFGIGGIGRISLPYVCGGIALMKLRGINIDVSACGGIRDHLDVIKYLMSGATSAQVCTAAMVEGLGIGADILEGLTSWLEAKGHKSVEKITGAVATREKLRGDISKQVIETPLAMGGPAPSVMIVVDESKKCFECCWCEECCPQLALHVENHNPIIDQTKCEVCGLCVAVCPAALFSIKPRKAA